MHTPYNKNRLEMVDALLEKSDLSGSVLDFGCGDGVMSESVLSAGGSVHAVDLEPSMVESTQCLLEQWAERHPGANYSVQRGGVEGLSSLTEGSFDTILAINVLAYMNGGEERQFYTQSKRLLRSGGVLLVTHSNELFDLYTLNKYTQLFFKHHFSTHAAMDEVGSLLVHPDEPDRRIFPVRENPLNYRYKLGSYGFMEERQEFSIFHKLPPLLMEGFDPDDLQSRDYPDTIHWPASERWKLMFMCSIFGSRAISLPQR